MSFARMPAEDVTENAVLDGRLVLRQPRTGHRVGHDAILLAAATEAGRADHAVELGAGDRKSTRLNSSHLVISYAVFCLKKKNKDICRFMLLTSHLASSVTT